MSRIGSDAWAFRHLAAEYVSALMKILGRKCCLNYIDLALLQENEHDYRRSKPFGKTAMDISGSLGCGVGVKVLS